MSSAQHEDKAMLSIFPSHKYNPFALLNSFLSGISMYLSISFMFQNTAYAKKE